MQCSVFGIEMPNFIDLFTLPMFTTLKVNEFSALL